MVIELTDDMLLCQIRAKFEIAKADLAKTEPRFGEKTDFMPRVAVILPDGRETTANLPWTDFDEKYRWGRAASEAARHVLAQALIFSAVVTGLNEHNVNRELGVKSYRDVTPDEYQRRLFQWCKLKTGSTILGRLPRRFRQDQMFVIGMGPKLAGCMARQSFDWADAKPMWKEDFEIFDCRDKGTMEFPVIPKWWE